MAQDFKQDELNQFMKDGWSYPLPGSSSGGANGLSAYQIALKHGFNGSESAWLESLKASISNTEFDNRVNAYLTEHGITGGNSAEITEKATIYQCLVEDFAKNITVIPTEKTYITGKNIGKFVGYGWNNTALAVGETITTSGVEVTLNADGTIRLNGTSTADFYIQTNLSSEMRNVLLGKQLRLSIKHSGSQDVKLTSLMYFDNLSYAQTFNSTEDGATFTGTLTDTTSASPTRIEVISGSVFDNAIISFMVEIIGTNPLATEYEVPIIQEITEETTIEVSVYTDYFNIFSTTEFTMQYTLDGGLQAYTDKKLSAMKKQNPLYGKTVACVGDSLCYGEGYQGGYCAVLGEIEQDTIFLNLGLGGSMISSNHANGGYYHIEAQYNKLESVPDYVIAEGYTNDYLTNVALGSMSNGYEVELDTTTFYGGLESLLKKMVTDYGSARCGYIITHTISDTNDVATNGAYIEAIKECCDKWNVPYLDLSNIISPVVPINEQYYTDGLHYNEIGYRRISAAIGAWIKTL